MIKDQRLEVPQSGDSLRNGAVQEIGAHIEDLERREPVNLGGQGTPQAEVREGEDLEVGEASEGGQEGVDGEAAGKRRGAVVAGDMELGDAVLVAHHGDEWAGVGVAQVCRGVPAAQGRRVVKETLDSQ